MQRMAEKQILESVIKFSNEQTTLVTESCRVSSLIPDILNETPKKKALPALYENPPPAILQDTNKSLMSNGLENPVDDGALDDLQGVDAVQF